MIPPSYNKASPTSDFAFEPPRDYKSTAMPSDGPQYGMGAPASQFSIPSSTPSFSLPGNSSSDTADSLPRISRNFAPPSVNDTRRPATAAGTVDRVSGRDLAKLNKRRSDAIAEEGGFQNPFAASPADNIPSQPPTVDPHFVPETNGSTTWQSQASSAPQSGVGYSSGPVHLSNFAYVNLPNGVTRQASSVPRPQTSDGLPSYPSHMNGNVPLPSARTLIGGYGSQLGYTPVGASLVQSGQVINGFASRYGGSFDASTGRYMALGLAASSGENELQFVSLAGPAPKKRSRRRYDEIERIYACDWKGCDKAYGTLNHLNAHVAMQKHGEKRLPAQFKEMRKEWRKKKREEAAVSANKDYGHHGADSSDYSQSSLSGDYHQGGASASSGWASRGDNELYSSAAPSYSTVGNVGVDNSDPFGHRGSSSSFMTNAPTWSSSDTRPTTANTVSSGGSPTDGRFAYSVPWSAGGNSGSQYAGTAYRKSDTGLPVSSHSDYPTPTQQNPTFNPYVNHQHGLM